MSTVRVLCKYKKIKIYYILAFFISVNMLFAQKNLVVISETKVSRSTSGKYHAIIISVNQYQDDSFIDLDEPEKDANKLFALLVSKYFFQKEDIIRLIDPTRGDIIDAIESKRKILNSEDNLLIFYAGHGFWDPNLKMGYWQPSDSKSKSVSNWVSNDDLSCHFDAIQANHILVIADACWSGGIFKTRGISNMNEGVKRLYELKSRKAMTSANLTPVNDNSVFMRYFLQELESNESAFLTSDQLFLKIRNNIINNSSTSPLYAPIPRTNDGGGEFVFYAPGAKSMLLNDDISQLVTIIRQPNKSQNKAVINEENKFLDKPTRVAIINFDNTTGKVGEYGDIGGPLRDMLKTDLAGVKNLTIIDRQALEKVFDEQNINNSTRFDRNYATKIGKLLGVEFIMTGTYFEFYGNLRVDAKFINVETGEIAFSVGVDGARDKLIDLKNSLANKIIEKLK
jgi:TolB-like protein